ncbi:hypothetical protein BC829DRAFT_13059 [Chytridium lagenaria]|nr:hypothetical protein BC829DRAFT_13059 [Chytridium lagenaria]
MADHIQYLEEFVSSVENLPFEIRHVFDEIRDKDAEFQEIKAQINARDLQLRKIIKAGPVDPIPSKKPGPAGTPSKLAKNGVANGDNATLPSTEAPPTINPVKTEKAPNGAPSNTTPPPPPQPSIEAAKDTNGQTIKSEEVTVTATTGEMAIAPFPDQKLVFDTILNMFKKGEDVSDEKIALVHRSMLMLDRHIRRLTMDIEAITRLEREAGVNVPDLPAPSLHIPPALASVPSVASLLPLASSASLLGTPGVARLATSYMGTPLGAAALSKGSFATPAGRRGETPERMGSGLGVTPKGTALKRRISSVRLGGAQKSVKKMKRKNTTGMEDVQEEGTPEVDEQLYCFCRQVSYGEMIACDGENCANEWFHLECVGLTEPPKGVWYCPDCSNGVEDEGMEKGGLKRKKKKVR